MNHRWEVGTIVLVICAVGAFVWGVFLTGVYRQRYITLSGAVIQKAANPRGESPIAEAEISSNGMAAQATRSDSSGMFQLNLRPGVERGQAITLLFKHPGFEPLVMPTYVGDQLYIARMAPIPPKSRGGVVGPRVVVSDVLVRYLMQSTTTESVGTAAKTFQVANRANTPCDPGSLCSPDGKWKASMGTISLDAGKGNVFQNPRVSCIAGPCPFTRVDFVGLTQGGSTVEVTARAWAGTATFLLQAEVVHPEVGDAVQESYPVIFGHEMNFSLPAAAEGPSLEATLNGVRIVFPIPPSPDLSWTDCTVTVEPRRTKLFRCELNPGYQFQ